MRAWPVLIAVIGCSSAQTTHSIGTPVPAGNGSVTAVCDSSGSCESELATIKRATCSNEHIQCSLVERVDGVDRKLVTWDAQISTLAYDAAHLVVWVVSHGQVLGVGTSASPGPGAIASAPAVVADAHDVEAHRVIDGGRLVVFKAGAKFRIWEPASGRALEVVAANGSPAGVGTGAEIGDHAIGYCWLDGADLRWTTIDLAGSLDDGHGRIDQGATPAPAVDPDAHACARIHAR